MKSSSNLENVIGYRKVVSLVPKFNVESLNIHPFYHEEKAYFQGTAFVYAMKWADHLKNVEENYSIITQ